jgi:WD40 repeat protein
MVTRKILLCAFLYQMCPAAHEDPRIAKTTLLDLGANITQVLTAPLIRKNSEGYLRGFQVKSLNASENNIYLGVLNTEGQVKIWKFENERYQDFQTIDINKKFSHFSSISFLADGSYLAVGGYRDVFIYKLNNNKYDFMQEINFDQTIGTMNSDGLIFLNNGGLLISTTKYIFVYELDEHNKYHQVKKQNGEFSIVACDNNNNGSLIATFNSKSNFMQLFDIVNNKECVIENIKFDKLADIQVSGNYIVTLDHPFGVTENGKHEIIIWQWQGNKLECIQSISCQWTSSLVLKDNQLAILNRDDCHIYQLNNKKHFEQVSIIKLRENIIYKGLRFLPCLKRIIAISNSNENRWYVLQQDKYAKDLAKIFQTELSWISMASISNGKERPSADTAKDEYTKSSLKPENIYQMIMGYLC